MTDSAKAYPLAWPVGWKRTQPTLRRKAMFRRTQGNGGQRELTIHEATQRLQAQIDRYGVDSEFTVLSTNLVLRLDGQPRSGQAEPTDPGAAVYWREVTGEARVMAIDIYDRVADNIAALAATLEAMRAIERHGGAVVLERVFTGFAALPAPGAAAGRDWREVLGFGPDWAGNAAAVEAQFRRLASERHPDKGGSADAMAELNLARQAALEAVGS